MSDIFKVIAARDEAALRDMLERNPAAAHAVNGDGISAIMWALYHNEYALATLVREQGIELTIWEASAYGDKRAVERILELQPRNVHDTGPDGFTPLHLAAYFGRPDVVEVLLRRGADANRVAENHSKVTPLHSAVTGRNYECVAALLAAGAEPNVVQAGGFTPLHSAAEHDDREIYDALISAGADPSTAAEDGRTAFRA